MFGEEKSYIVTQTYTNLKIIGCFENYMQRIHFMIRRIEMSFQIHAHH